MSWWIGLSRDAFRVESETRFALNKPEKPPTGIGYVQVATTQQRAKAAKSRVRSQAVHERLQPMRVNPMTARPEAAV